LAEPKKHRLDSLKSDNIDISKNQKPENLETKNLLTVDYLESFESNNFKNIRGMDLNKSSDVKTHSFELRDSSAKKKKLD